MRKNFESDSTLTLQEHFRILGIDTDGSYEEAQKAYRGLVRVYGESGAEPNENKLKQLNVSWDALKKHFDETRNSPEAILNDPISELEKQAKAAGVWDEVGSTIEKVQSGRLDARLIDRLASNDDPELSSDQITLDYLKEKIEMAIKRKNG